jgi:REP element-mobilizing transposase RayT
VAATDGRTALPHQARPELRSYEPVHVTLRFLPHVWNLRSRRSFDVISAAFAGVARRPDLRIVHFSVQGNHAHLLVEAHGAAALANGMRALCIRIARGLNRMMGRTGPVFSDRYHAHVLRTPAEARNALRYAVGNFASHAARRGEHVRTGYVDRFSSASAELPLSPPIQQELFSADGVLTRPVETWLLRKAA